MIELGSANGEPLALDLERLIGSHMGIVANSGGGKSGLIRKLLEATHGHIQHIVLDSEDEFYTLRERHDYVIAGGDGGDTPATVENADQLPIAALTHGFSLICQINDLGRAGANEFIDRFLAAMIAAPRNLWHPCLVVIDEAQRFEADALRRLTEAGRKRGFTAVLATQRLPKLDANIRGDLNNWIMGRVGQALDRRTMADQLGMSTRGAELAKIEPRHFFAFGPALSRDPVQFRVGDVETTMIRPGAPKVHTPPPPEALREILAGLAVATDEPKAEQNIPGNIPTTAPSATNTEIKRLRARVAELEAEQQNWTIESAYGQQQLDALIAERDELRRLIAGFVADTERVRVALADEKSPSRSPVAASPPAAQASAPKERPLRENAGVTAGETVKLGAERKPLAALAQVYPSGLTEPQWATSAGFKRSGGTWGTYKSRLRTAGLIEQRGDRWFATEDGAAAVGDVELPPAPGADLVRWWTGKLSGVGPMAEVLIDAFPAWLSREELAERIGIAAAGGTFGTYLSRLAGPELIERDRERGVRLNPEMMGVKR